MKEELPWHLITFPGKHLTTVCLSSGNIDNLDHTVDTVFDGKSCFFEVKDYRSTIACVEN